MNWLEKWFFNKFKKAWDADAHMFGSDAVKKSSSNLNSSAFLVKEAERDSIEDDRAIMFKVIPASGGRVVETRFYDKKKDRWITSLYIIQSGDDFGKNIEKILSMETLKQ